VLIAAAICPHPPLLIPEVSGPGPAPAAASAAAAVQATAAASTPAAVQATAAASTPAAASELAALRSACDAAVAELMAAGADLIEVVGTAAEAGCYPGSAAGSLRPFGVRYHVGDGEPVLPLSLTIGRWLLARAGLDPAADQGGAPRVLLRAIFQRTPAAECLSLGAQIAAQAPRVALLGMGDGPARGAIGAPEAADPEAERYHAEAAAALAAADPDRLARLDPGRDAELMVAGRAVWQVLAGAAAGQRLRGRLRFAAAPLRVSYLVASWAVPD
jgi:hypothetical protein